MGALVHINPAERENCGSMIRNELASQKEKSELEMKLNLKRNQNATV